MIGSNNRKRVRSTVEINVEAKKSKPSAPPKALRNGELADQIKQMFADNGFVEKPANGFDTISNILFDRVMKDLMEKKSYIAMYDKYKSEWEEKKKTNNRLRTRRPLCSCTFFLKTFYQLQFVNRRFADYFVRRVKDLPKVPIGVRIQNKPEKTKKTAESYDSSADEGKVVYSIHFGLGIIPSNLCDSLNNIDYALRFGRISYHFDVFGLPLDDSLLTAIKKIDTSQVSSAYFYNIPYVYFEGDVQKKAQELISLFPKATIVDFNGIGFDPVAVFGDDKECDSNLKRKDVKLTANRMVDACMQITAQRRSLKGRRMVKKSENHLLELRTAVEVEGLLKLGSDFARYDPGDFSDGSPSPATSPRYSPMYDLNNNDLSFDLNNNDLSFDLNDNDHLFDWNNNIVHFSDSDSD